MRQITPDLWETAADAPAPGLTTHAYLWTPPAGGNVLFYNTATDRDHDEVARRGGVAHQYLSHRDEVSPMLRVVGERFGALLHTSAVEAGSAARFRVPDVTFDTRHVDAQGIDVIPTPGHSPGSTCYLVTGAAGRYLFVGDTMFTSAEGRWRAGYIEGYSDAAPLAASLDLLAGLEPDLVASSAFGGEHGAHLLGERHWADCVAEARGSLPLATPARDAG